MADSKIEWTDKTWNPVRGCALVSAGCENCYAMKFAHRFSGKGGRYEGLTELGPKGPRWNGNVRVVPEMLEAPLHWTKPGRIFVNSMSDLFHKDVPEEFIDRVFAVMAICAYTVRCRRKNCNHEGFSCETPRVSPMPFGHVFQILTKRPESMRDYLTSTHRIKKIFDAMGSIGWHFEKDGFRMELPLPNVWLGVSVENQKAADERIPLLLETPGWVRWISAEPLLSAIDISKWLSPCSYYCDHDADGGGHRPERGIEWVVVGGESGGQARPFNVKWPIELIQECKAASIPVFVKQVGSDPFFSAMGEDVEFPSHVGVEWSGHGVATGRPCLTDRKGGDPTEWPEDLRVREFPT